MNNNMTKNNLVKKVLNGAKNFALGATVLGAALVYSDKADAQKTASNLTESTNAKVNTVSAKKAINLKYVPAFVVPSEKEKDDADKPLINFYPKQTTIARGDELYGILNYTLNKAKVDEKEVDYVKYKGTATEQKKLESLIQKEGESGQVLKVDVSKAKELPYTIINTQNNGSFFYFPIDESTDSLVKIGKRLGIVIPVEKSEIALDFRNKEDPILIGNPNSVYYIDLKETEVLDQALYNEEKGKLDSLGTKYLADDEAKKIWEANPSNSKDVYKFIDLPFLTDKPAKEEEKTPSEKTPSEINGRLKVGAGFTIPKGYNFEINPQIQLGEKVFLGPYFSYSNSSKSLENMTQEDPQRVLISLPAQMYWVSTGTKITETNKVQNNAGLGVNFSYNGQHLDASLKVGFLGQKTKTTRTSEGEQYMEIAGAKDSASVYSFNESNDTITKKSIFKGAPMYIGGSAEYFPLKSKGNALSNISVYGEAGYVFGKTDLESGILGTIGVKYTLTKPKKDKKE